MQIIGCDRRFYKKWIFAYLTLSNFLLATEGAGFSFIPASQIFREEITIRFSASAPEHEIRFTTDGSEPTSESPRYYQALSLSKSTRLRARLFSGGEAISDVIMAFYLKEKDSLIPYRSNLPLIILKPWDQQRPNDLRYQDCSCALIEPDDSGLSQLNSPISFSSRAGIKVRGSSTAKNPKPSFNLELRDEQHQDIKASLLGLPSESDWVLRAPYAMDRALIRNALIFKISRRLGYYAPRTRFVEVFLDRDDDGLRYPEDYLGVYVLTEKIKRGRSRVRIHQLKEDETSGSDLSGGYLFKDDRPDPGDQGISVVDAGKYFLVDPKEAEIAPEQSRYLRSVLNDFTIAVKSPLGKHPIHQKGYHDYIDLRSWLVWHWLNTLSGNLDTYKASAYFYKNHESRNNGRIEAGPLWDFDRSMNSFDDRDDSPFGWIANGEGGTALSDSRAPWWGWLLNHQDAKQAHIDLWHEMRGDVLRWESLEKMINDMAQELQGGDLVKEQNGSSPVSRNFGKWMEVSPRGGAYRTEIKILKDWLKLRLQWIDSQFVTPPKASLQSSLVNRGTAVHLSGPEGALIHYTTDGSDPLKSPSAKILNTDTSVEIKQSFVLKARCRLGIGATSWSGLLRRVYLVPPHAIPTALEVTEISWKPKRTANDGEFKPYEFEYFALQNTSQNETIDLTGSKFSQGIDFNFDQSKITILQPGELVYLAYHKDAFTHRYGMEKAKRLVGEFRNSRLNNKGESIQLVDGAGRLLLQYQSTSRARESKSSQHHRTR
ncbi:MAG: CotH kinase family protein [Akkermansiaceae bacterium]